MRAATLKQDRIAQMRKAYAEWTTPEFWEAMEKLPDRFLEAVSSALSKANVAGIQSERHMHYVCRTLAKRHGKLVPGTEGVYQMPDGTLWSEESGACDPRGQ